LSHVILYSPPENPESYILRAGRTGRAGAAGTVISLVDVMQKMELMRISRQYGIQLQERALPSEADLAAHVTQRITTVLEAKWRAKDSLEQERMRRYVDVVRTMSQDDDQALLLAMLLDSAYQKAMHTPPPLPEGRKPEAADCAPRAREGSREGGRDGGRPGEARRGGEGSGRRRRR